jgi:amino acid permease
LALVLFTVVLFGANIGVFQAEVFSWFDFITGYMMIPGFLALYLIHKWRNKTAVVPLKECNFEME